MSQNDPNAKLFNPHIPSGNQPKSGTGVDYIPTPPIIAVGGAQPATSIATTSYIAASTAPYWSSSYSGTNVLSSTGPVSAPDFVIDGVSMKDTLRAIQDRLDILIPDPEKLEKYAALKAAYDHYKTLEALIGDGDNLPKKE